MPCTGALSCDCGCCWTCVDCVGMVNWPSTLTPNPNFCLTPEEPFSDFAFLAPFPLPGFGPPPPPPSPSPFLLFSSPFLPPPLSLSLSLSLSLFPPPPPCLASPITTVGPSCGAFGLIPFAFMSLSYRFAAAPLLTMPHSRATSTKSILPLLACLTQFRRNLS
jgi:hypothetical protein